MIVTLTAVGLAILLIVASYLHYLSSQKKKVLDFDEEYLIRECTASDLDAINEMCSNVYHGADFLHHYWLEYINNESYVVFGVEYRKTKRIVSTQLVQIHDGGVKGTLFGDRTHLKHRRKGLISKLKCFSKNQVKVLYPKLLVWESITSSGNIPSLKVQSKHGMKLINNRKYTFGVITKLKWDDNNLNAFVCLKDYEFNLRLDNIYNICNEANPNNKNDEYVYVEDVDEIIYLMSTTYEQKEIFYDWKLYKISDLNNSECINDAKMYLKKQMTSKRLYCLVNNNKKILCMITVDKRAVIQLHLWYSTDINTVDLITMIRYLYHQWYKNYSSLYKDHHTFMYIFMNQYFVDKDEILSQLFSKFDSVIVFNTCSTYYS